MDINDNAAPSGADDDAAPDGAEPGGSPADRRPLGFWLRTVDGLLTRAFAEAFAAEGVSRRDWMLLSALSGEVDAADLADKARRGKRLSGLEDRGWIVETGSGWELTDEGRAAHQRLAAIVQVIRDRVSGAVSPEDFATMTAALEAIARELGWDETERTRWGRRGGFGPGRGRRFGPGFGMWRGFGPWGFGPWGVGPRGWDDGSESDDDDRGGRQGFAWGPRFGADFDARRGFGPGSDPRGFRGWDHSGHHGHGHRSHGHHGYAHGHGDWSAGHKGRAHRGEHRTERAYERGFAAGFEAAQRGAGHEASGSTV